MFTVNKVPGFAAQLRRDGQTRSGGIGKRVVDANAPSPKSQENIVRSRDSSPKNPRPRSEEIPLADMRIRKSSLVTNGSSSSSSQHSLTPDLPDISPRINPVSDESSTTMMIKKHSEETSFTSPQTSTSHIISKPRRKGQVETV